MNVSQENSVKNLATVRAIGAGERKLNGAADAIVSENSDMDWTTKGAATTAVYKWLGLTKDTAPKQMDADKNKTDFGRGFGSLVSAVNNRTKATSTTVTLRATLSGEGGGSVTVPAGPLYDALIALIHGDNA